MASPAVTFLDDADRIVETLSPFRREVLAALTSPSSATEIARQLDTTRQRVNYHLRALEDAGLVQLYEERQRRGLTERVMRRSADVVMVDPAAFDSANLSRADAAGVTGVVAVAADLIRHAAAVSAAASASDQRVAAATLDTTIRVESPPALRAMLEEVAAVVARYDSGETGLEMRVTTSVLPEVDRP